MDRGLVYILSFFSFWLGACIASFLNVVIWRVPRGESIVTPPSHCPKCGSSIRWWQNIPILSWLALRGKCASCRAPISPRYILVEMLGGVLFLAAFLLVVLRGAGWFSVLDCGVAGDAAPGKWLLSAESLGLYAGSSRTTADHSRSS